jgi:hypothetical protein
VPCRLRRRGRNLNAGRFWTNKSQNRNYCLRLAALLSAFPAEFSRIPKDFVASFARLRYRSRLLSTASFTGHVRDFNVGPTSSQVAGGHAETAAPATVTLGYSAGNVINRIAMVLAAFQVSAPPAP